MLYDRLSRHVLALTKDGNNMKCHVRLKMQKIAEMQKMLASSKWHFLSEKCFKTKVDLEAEGVFLFIPQKGEAFWEMWRELHLSKGRRDWPSQSSFIFRLYSFWLKFQPSQKGTNLSFWVHTKLLHIVANNNAASVMFEKELLNLALLQPDWFWMGSVSLLYEHWCAVLGGKGDNFIFKLCCL